MRLVQQIAESGFDTEPEFQLGLLRSFQRVFNRTGNCGPLFCFNSKLTLAGSSPTVELGSPIILRITPEGAQPPSLFQAVKGRKERSRLDLKCPPGDLLNAAGNPQSVHFAFTDCFQDQQIEGALQEIRLIPFHPSTPIEQLYEY